MQSFLSFFLLILLLNRIKTGSSNVPSPEEIASKLQLKNNLNKTLGEIESTTANTVEHKDREDNEPTTISVDINEHEEKINNISIKTKRSRPSRYASKEAGNLTMQCVSCYGAGISNEDCYTGTSSKIENCADIEACYTELHPQYIKRGCTLPLGLNRTFVCKCPLCNDKPAKDVTYYEYRTLNDWKYDNERLERPLLGLDLFCKVCETTGHNAASDNICRNGTRVDYVLCGHGQLCFTNVDFLTDHVSRGCIDTPVYNSMTFLCNSSFCNRVPYENPARTKRHLMMKSNKMTEISAATTGVANKYLVALNIYLFTSVILSQNADFFDR